MRVATNYLRCAGGIGVLVPRLEGVRGQQARQTQESREVNSCCGSVANSHGQCYFATELIGWIADYPAMKRLHLEPTPQIELMIALAIVIVLAALIYYGRLVWLLVSPD